jgi:starvation-inducible DNA-binding protein
MSTPTNVPALGAHEREEIGDQLQDALVALIDLSLHGKQLRWSVVGREFRTSDLHLDELIDPWREPGDSVAERAVAIGSFPDGQARTVAAAATVTPVACGPIPDGDVVRGLTHRWDR